MYSGPRDLDLFLSRKSYSIMKSIIILLVGLIFVVEGAINAHVNVGDYAQVLNMVEKVFVDTSGTARKIWKGGVVVRDDTGDGKCHIAIKELRDTYTELVTYAVDCGRLLPSDFACPTAASVPYKCQQSDVACSSDSLFYNGFVVIDGPINNFPGSTTAASFAERKYFEMKSIAQQAGLDPHSLEFHYSDVSSRGPGRWEMQVTVDDLADSSMNWLPNMWQHAQENLILPALTGAVNKARSARNTAIPSQSSVADSDIPLFKAVFDGVLISTPGADTQHWHRDSGRHTLDISHYTVYIATTDVTAEMGPTEFLPGTNRDFSFKFDDWANYFDYCASTERPLLSAGIYDSFLSVSSSFATSFCKDFISSITCMASYGFI